MDGRGGPARWRAWTPREVPDGTGATDRTLRTPAQSAGARPPVASPLAGASPGPQVGVRRPEQLPHRPLPAGLARDEREDVGEQAVVGDAVRVEVEGPLARALL